MQFCFLGILTKTPNIVRNNSCLSSFDNLTFNPVMYCCVGFINTCVYRHEKRHLRIIFLLNVNAKILKIESATVKLYSL